MKLFLRFFFALIILPTAIGGLLYHLNRHGFFELDHIEIVLQDAPAQSLHLKPLVDELDRKLETLRGKSLWVLDMGDISKSISALNWVEGHSIARSWPSGITIKIKPQEVKALYIGKNNKFTPVIREGKLLDPVEAKAAPDVAILDGENFITKPELRQKAVAALDQIPKEGPFSRKTISEIHWNNKDGFLMKMTRSGLEVKMGEDQMALKSARISQVIEYLANHNLEAKTLDANLSKKVLVKLQDPKEIQTLR